MKNKKEASEVNNIIEEPAKKDEQKKSRGRREAFTGSASSLRLLGALAIILCVISVLPIRRRIQRLVRN